MNQPSPAKAVRVLVVDDEPNLRRVMSKELARAGFEVATAASGEEALAQLESQPCDVLLLDLKMPGIGGLEVLRRLRRQGLGCEVIILTGHGSIDSVVEAMKLGAYDYLTKPCRLSEIELLVRRAHDHGSAQPTDTPEDGTLVAGASMQPSLRMIDRSAPTEVPVLIEGETGTGKELLARRLHAKSLVAKGPFVVVNCGALQPDLILSELFGHEEGSFTGATKRRVGLLEQADAGTVFFDEIGELPLDAQVRLLRFLQFGEIRPVGSSETRSVKTRFVAATNRTLLEEAKAGRFREDLFYRLNAIHVVVPPLRDRADDIAALVDRCLTRSLQGKGRRFAPDALSLLLRYRWPGNVRELENIVQRMAILSEADVIPKSDVLEYFQGLALGGAQTTSSSSARTLK
ncbi:MAG: sigma-54-dependent transcriptional regulator, partial [Planctomycetota bacterium]